jgi:hypothetical protein
MAIISGLARFWGVRSLLLALVNVAGLGVSQALADEIDDNWDFVWSNTIHMLHHEIGHALIDQFELPVIGQEEDAVDAFATFAILDSYDSAQQILVDTAAGWFALHQRADEGGETPAYHDEHDLDIQRGFRVLCHAYGYDPEAFAKVVAEMELPRERQETCLYDSELGLESWDKLLKDAYRPDGEKPGGMVNIRVQQETDYDIVRDEVLESGLLAETAKWLDETYRLPNTITFAAEECGEDNAFYDPETRTVTLCYEMIDELYGLAEDRSNK